MPQRAEKRRQRDIDFLSWLSKATRRDLAAMLKTPLPEWRRVAIMRAIKRNLLGARR